MRRPPLLVLCLLSLASGLLLAGGFDMLTQSPRLEASSARPDDLALVRRFYDAVNTTLRTGDVQSLNAVVASDLVEHPTRAGRPSGRAGFAEALAGLRTAYPDLQLIPTEITTVGGVVTARVAVSGTSGAHILGFPLDGRDAWGPLDVFRIAGGRVVEHWGVPPEVIAPASPALATIALPPPRWRVLELLRLTFEPGQEATYEDPRGPLLIAVETGRVTITLDQDCAGPATVVTAAFGDRSPFRDVVPAGGHATLFAGDLLTPAAGGCETVRNDDATPASVMILRAPVPAVPGGVGGMAPAPVDPAVPITTTVAGGIAATLPEDEAIVALGRVTLGPGGVFPAHTASGPELIAVEEGRLTLAATGGTVWVRRGPDGLTRRETQADLGAGDAVLVPAGVTAEYRAAGDEPVGLLVVTLAPASPALATPAT